MPLFSRRRELAVQSFILDVVNNNCSEVKTLADGPRLEGRVNLTLVVMIIPVDGKELKAEQAFTAVTKEFSTTGLAVVLGQPMGLDEVVVGFRREQEMAFARATAKHLNPIGGGFFQLGLRLSQMVPAGDYPQLQRLSF